MVAVQGESVSPDNGVIRATVIGVADPLRLGRVLILLQDGSSETEAWARVASSSRGARGEGRGLSTGSFG